MANQRTFVFEKDIEKEIPAGYTIEMSLTHIINVSVVKDFFITFTELSQFFGSYTIPNALFLLLNLLFILYEIYLNDKSKVRNDLIATLFTLVIVAV